jgi:hypothetical protein
VDAGVDAAADPEGAGGAGFTRVSGISTATVATTTAVPAPATIRARFLLFAALFPALAALSGSGLSAFPGEESNLAMGDYLRKFVASVPSLAKDSGRR